MAPEGPSPTREAAPPPLRPRRMTLRHVLVPTSRRAGLVLRAGAVNDQHAIRPADDIEAVAGPQSRMEPAEMLAIVAVSAAARSEARKAAVSAASDSPIWRRSRRPGTPGSASMSLTGMPARQAIWRNTSAAHEPAATDSAIASGRRPQHADAAGTELTRQLWEKASIAAHAGPKPSVASATWDAVV